MKKTFLFITLLLFTFIPANAQDLGNDIFLPVHRQQNAVSNAEVSFFYDINNDGVKQQNEQFNLRNGVVAQVRFQVFFPDGNYAWGTDVTDENGFISFDLGCGQNGKVCAVQAIVDYNGTTTCWQSTVDEVTNEIDLLIPLAEKLFCVWEIPVE